jgi:dihydrofolate reductase
MRLTATTFISLDGVYQGPGGPNEDTRGGFTLGGWTVPFFDDETGAFMDEVFGHVDEFLLGRRTYEIFASAWPSVTDPGDPIASKLNGLPKHVVSTTLTDPSWHNTSVAAFGDVAALKARDGDELQVHGSGALLASLLGAGLVDRLRLLVFPVVLGQGLRLFREGVVAPSAWTLAGSRTTSSGVTIQELDHAGEPETGEFELAAEPAAPRG